MTQRKRVTTEFLMDAWTKDFVDWAEYDHAMEHTHDMVDKWRAQGHGDEFIAGYTRALTDNMDAFGVLAALVGNDIHAAVLMSNGNMMATVAFFAHCMQHGIPFTTQVDDAIAEDTENLDNDLMVLLKEQGES